MIGRYGFKLAQAYSMGLLIRERAGEPALKHLKISMAYYQFLPSYGGIENHIFSVSKELAKRSHKVTVITTNLFKMRSSILPAAEKSSGVNVIRLKSKVVRLGAEIPICPVSLFQQLPACDVLHLHSINLNFFMAPLHMRALIYRIPIVLTPHAHPDRLCGYYRNPLLRAYHRRVVPLLLKETNAIIALTPSEKQLYQKWGIPKVFEVPHGTDLELHKIDPGKMAGFIHTHDPEKRKILFVGRMTEHKGLQTILECLPFILKTCRDVVLYAVGAYSEYACHLQALAQYLRCDKNVRFFFDVPDKDLPYFYEISDLVVLPSRQIEAFGLVILEAWAHRKPVLVFKRGGLRDLVSQGGGQMVDSLSSKEWGLAIMELLNDQRKLRKLGNEGRKLVKEKYTWELVAKKTEQVYTDLLSEP